MSVLRALGSLFGRQEAPAASSPRADERPSRPRLTYDIVFECATIQLVFLTRMGRLGFMVPENKGRNLPSCPPVCVQKGLLCRAGKSQCHMLSLHLHLALLGRAGQNYQTDAFA